MKRKVLKAKIMTTISLVYHKCGKSKLRRN